MNALKMMNVLKTMALFLIVTVSSICFISCGDDDDDNNEPTPVETNYSSLIPGHWECPDNPREFEVRIGFNYDGLGTVYFSDLVNKTVGNYGVMAYGTYTLNGSKITATYNSVMVDDADGNPSAYHGFSNGKAHTVVYEILSCDGQKLVLKDESGKTTNYKKESDVN